MRPTDFIILAQLKDESPLFIITPSGSSGEARLRLLFGIKDIHTRGHIEFFDTASNVPLDFQSRYILDALGIKYFFEDENLIEIISGAFGNEFPTTRQFSEFARNYAVQSNRVAIDEVSPDVLLMEWYETEELLFRTFEKKLINERLVNPFIGSDEFIDFAKSIMNRRSARAGFALENHVETILIKNGINFTRGAMTENKSKPDFIFPSIEKYRNSKFPSDLLTVLAVKSSCKDRWRQALAEADRISNTKHLLTLEPAISLNQTNEMHARSLQLVVPLKLHSTFSPKQQEWLWSFDKFIVHLQKLQAESVLP